MKKETILLIQQNAQSETHGMHQMRKMLTEHGYQIVSVHGEKDALEQIKKQAVDYAMLDCRTAQKMLQSSDSNRNEKIKDSRGRLEIDLQRRIVKVNNQEIHLTPTEYNLLAIMAKSPHRTFSRAELIAYALGDEFHGYDRSIDTYIKSLRKKIENNTGKPEYICTVHGAGYKFIP